MNLTRWYEDVSNLTCAAYPEGADQDRLPSDPRHQHHSGPVAGDLHRRHCHVVQVAVSGHVHRVDGHTVVDERGRDPPHWGYHAPHLDGIS